MCFACVALFLKCCINEKYLCLLQIEGDTAIEATNGNSD